MKATTLIKTINFSEFRDPLLTIDNGLNAYTLGEGFEVDYWINKIATELKLEDFIKLSENFICVGFDTVETYTFIRKSYLVSQLKAYIIHGANEDFTENAIIFGAVDSIMKRTNFRVGDQPSNIATQTEMTYFEEGNNTELSELMKDVDSCGLMELYFDNYSDFLDTILGKENRIVTSDSLDLFLDTVAEVYPKEVYYSKREEKQARVLENEVCIFLNNLTQFLTIDQFGNKEKIVEFIVEDILECTTYDDYNSEDIKIAFRRLVEAKFD